MLNTIVRKYIWFQKDGTKKWIFSVCLWTLAAASGRSLPIVLDGELASASSAVATPLPTFM
jgi:hypothetical protein